MAGHQISFVSKNIIKEDLAEICFNLNQQISILQYQLKVYQLKYFMMY